MINLMIDILIDLFFTFLFVYWISSSFATHVVMQILIYMEHAAYYFWDFRI